MKRTLRSRKGFTLVEMLAATLILTILCLMVHTGVVLSVKTYRNIQSETSAQQVLSAVTHTLLNELRYARDVVTDSENNVLRYTSLSYGRNTTITINEDGELNAQGKQMISTGIYNSGKTRIKDIKITYKEGMFEVSFTVSGENDNSEQNRFSVRCINEL